MPMVMGPATVRGEATGNREPNRSTRWGARRTTYGAFGESGITWPTVRDTPEAGIEGLEGRNIEVWNDLVSPKDLMACLAVSAVCAVAAVLIAANTGGQTLYWGLGASVVGFVLNCFLVAPKRDVGIVDEMEPVDAGEEGAE